MAISFLAHPPTRRGSVLWSHHMMSGRLNAAYQFRTVPGGTKFESQVLVGCGSVHAYRPALLCQSVTLASILLSHVTLASACGQCEAAHFGRRRGPNLAKDSVTPQAPLLKGHWLVCVCEFDFAEVRVQTWMVGIQLAHIKSVSHCRGPSCDSCNAAYSDTPVQLTPLTSENVKNNFLYPEKMAFCIPKKDFGVPEKSLWIYVSGKKKSTPDRSHRRQSPSPSLIVYLVLVECSSRGS